MKYTLKVICSLSEINIQQGVLHSCIFFGSLSSRGRSLGVGTAEQRSPLAQPQGPVGVGIPRSTREMEMWNSVLHLLGICFFPPFCLYVCFELFSFGYS